MEHPNYSNWRAVAHTHYGDQHLLYVGISPEQVKKNFPGSFYEILTPEEQTAVNRVTLEKWKGSAAHGNWFTLESLKVPRVHKTAI